MSLTVNITQSDIMRALGDLLADILPSNTEVVQGQTNRVPSPKSNNYVVMNANGRARLATNEFEWDLTADNPATATSKMSMQVDIRIDVHGDSAADNATVIDQIMRDGYAATFMEQNDLAPRVLFCSEPQQVPFITAESQWDDRWIMTASLQANIVLTLPIETASELQASVNRGDSWFVQFDGDNAVAVRFLGDDGAGLTFAGVTELA